MCEKGDVRQENDDSLIRESALDQMLAECRNDIARVFLRGTGLARIEAIDLSSKALTDEVDVAEYIRRSGLTDRGQELKWEFAPHHAYTLVQSRMYKPEKDKFAKFPGVHACVYLANQDGSRGRPGTGEIEKASRRNHVTRMRPDGSSYVEYGDSVKVRSLNVLPPELAAEPGHISFLTFGQQAISGPHDELAFADDPLIEGEALVAIPCGKYAYLRMQVAAYRRGVAAITDDAGLRLRVRRFTRS